MKNLTPNMSHWWIITELLIRRHFSSQLKKMEQQTKNQNCRNYICIYRYLKISRKIKYFPFLISLGKKEFAELRKKIQYKTLGRNLTCSVLETIFVLSNKQVKCAICLHRQTKIWLFLNITLRGINWFWSLKQLRKNSKKETENMYFTSVNMGIKTL